MNPVENFLKEAGKWDAFKHGLTFGDVKDLGKGISGGERLSHQTGKMLSSGALGTGLVGGAALVGRGAEDLYGAATSGMHHRAEHQAMMQAHPSLQEEDPKEVEMVLKSIRNLSPSLAADPLVAGSLVRNILSFGRTEQGITMPAETAHLLADTQNKMTGKGPKSSLLDTFSTNMGGIKAPTVNNSFPSNTIQTADPSVTSTQHEYFDSEGNPTHSEHRKYER